MRKFITLLSIAILLVAMPAFAYDLSKPLGLGNEKTLQVDGEFIAGKTFSSNYAVVDEIDTLTLAAKQHEWLIQSEIGVKLLDVVRGFWQYETVTGMYNEDEFGIDVMFPVAGIDMGVRTSYVKRDDYKIAESEYWFSGVRLRF